MNISIPLVAILATTGYAYAAPGQGMPANLHPKSYCSVLEKVGYGPRPFNPRTGGCSTPMMPLGTAEGRNGLPNNIAFYSMGMLSDFSKLDGVSLILNVNAEKERSAARAELARAAAALTIALTGAEVRIVQKSVLAGTSTQTKAGAWRIKVESSKWPTGLGHDIAVRFTPAP